MTMLNFNSGYLAPGVYVQAVSTPTPSIASLSADVICVVGPAQGWLTSTDVFMLSASVPKTLSQAGIVEASIVVTDATGAIQAADLYTIVQTGSGVSIVTTIELAAGSTMTTTQAYYITYQYTNLNYYTPQWFTSQQTLFNTFGQPFTAGGGIASPISLAGMLVLQRSSLVVIMPTTDTGGVATRTGLSGAYTAMEAIGGIDLIVPLPVGMPGTVGTPGDIANVASDLAAFCAAQSAAGMGNNVNGILGFETGVTVAPDTVAASTANQRVVLAWPNSYGYYNSQAQQTLNVGGYYVAATLAGILSSQPVNLGLTRKVIGGFAGIPNNVLMTMTQPYKNQLSAAGVCVIEPAPGTGALWVRHGTTTDPKNTVTREFSLVRCGDAILQEFQSTYNQAGIIGDPVTSNILDIITSLATAALEYLMAQNIIAGYTSPSVVQDPNSPDVVNVTFGYSPEYPLNIINVQYSISTTTGTITPATSGGNASATSAYSGSALASA